MTQKVRCIKDDGYDIVHQVWIQNYPVKGEVYSIRKRVHSKNGLGVLLNEITNPLMPNGIEPNFSMRRFEPVTDDTEAINQTNYATEKH